MHVGLLFALPVVAYAASRAAGSVAARTNSRVAAATRVRRANRLLQIVAGLAGVAVATDSLLDDAVVHAVPGPGVLGVLVALAGTVGLGGVVPALAVHLGTRPAWATVAGGNPDYRSVVRRYLAAAVALTAPAFVVVAAWLVAPDGAPGLLAVAAAAFAIATLVPVAASRFAPTRELTRTERAAVPGCARGLRVRVLETDRNPVANALAAGVLPGYRYVFVTDALFDTLDPGAVTAVLAHEAAHHRRRHVAVRFLAVGGALAPLFLAASGVVDAFLPALVASAVLLLAAGPVVRWTEFDADRYAAEAVTPAAMDRALATLAARGLLPEDRHPVAGLVALHPAVADRRARLRDPNALARDR